MIDFNAQSFFSTKMNDDPGRLMNQPQNESGARSSEFTARLTILQLVASPGIFSRSGETGSKDRYQLQGVPILQIS